MQTACPACRSLLALNRVNGRRREAAFPLHAHYPPVRSRLLVCAVRLKHTLDALLQHFHTLAQRQRIYTDTSRGTRARQQRLRHLSASVCLPTFYTAGSRATRCAVLAGAPMQA